VEIFEGHRALFRPLASPAITIGNFDGVHMGHRALLAGTRAAADRLGGDAVAMTFEPHPAAFLAPDKVPPRLSSPARKQELLAAAGIDVALIESFDAHFARLSADDFTRQVLHEILQVEHVVVGHDFGYGSNRSGNIQSLQQAGESLGFTVEVISPVEVDGQRVSSSAIRKALIEGNLASANALLGRPYDVDGTVVRGAGRGREFGVPTANVDCSAVLLPRPGIYATQVQILGEPERYMAATSLGTNPTFKEGGALTLEANLLDFDRDLYGQMLRVFFVERLRDEERYDDVDALLAQIHKDIEQTRRIGLTIGNQ
jgi:riboflavin kinase/FMN adenylyltransferase